MSVLGVSLVELSGYLLGVLEVLLVAEGTSGGNFIIVFVWQGDKLLVTVGIFVFKVALKPTAAVGQLTRSFLVRALVLSLQRVQVRSQLFVDQLVWKLTFKLCCFLFLRSNLIVLDVWVWALSKGPGIAWASTRGKLASISQSHVIVVVFKAVELVGDFVPLYIHIIIRLVLPVFGRVVAVINWLVYILIPLLSQHV